MGKLLIKIGLILFTLLLFYLIKPASLVKAQMCGESCTGTCDSGLTCTSGVCVGPSCPACTGDSGRHGACTAAMACPAQWIDGTGSCTDPQVCCAEPPPGDGGTGDCSDTCSTSAQCLDSPVNLQCTNGVCNDPSICPTCTGSSGYAGTCLSPGVCTGRGKNANDGTGSCTGGSVCCTNAPTGNTCSFSLPSPFYIGYNYTASLNTNTPNTLYYLTGIGGCYQTPTVTTDGSGSATFTIQCTSTGSKTIEGRIAPAVITCSQNFTIIDCPAGGCPPTPPGGGGPGGANINWGALVGIATPNFINSNVANIITLLLPYIFGLAGFLLLLYIVLGGYQILMSRGDPKALAQGRDKITYAVVGFIVMFVAYWIVQLVGRILGLQPVMSIFP